MYDIDAKLDMFETTRKMRCKIIRVDRYYEKGSMTLSFRSL